jgi:hypothetical protein
MEYRAVSGVFRTIDPPPPLHPASVSSPRTKEGGVHTRRAVRGWGVNISEDARHGIGLLQYNTSTLPSLRSPNTAAVSEIIKQLLVLKASYTSLVSRLLQDAPTPTTHLVLSGPGAAISKMLRNLHELNVPCGSGGGVLALPWDGPLRSGPGDGGNCTVLVLVPTEGTVPEFEDTLEGRGCSYLRVL